MKKQSLKNLALNKVAISNFKIKEVNGGRGESLFNTVCPACETDDCPVKQYEF